jgi:ankyrin repeat protein
MRSGAEAAASMLQRVIAQHPDFISGRVLLAGMDIERNDIVAARAILDEVAPQSPTDVWIYLYQLRIQALSPQTVPGLRETLLAIANEPGFPGNVREIAARTGSRLANLTTAQFEEFLRVPFKFESGTAMPCKFATLARWLTDEGGRSRDVIALLESPAAHAAECGGLITNRALLATAYLLEAAKIAPGPTPANESLVARATQILDGDFGQLVTMLTGRPELTTLKPFFGKAAYVDRPNEHGSTPLCTAVYTRNPEALRVQLEGGANPMQKCSGWEPLRLIMSWAGPEQATERYEMARLLLEAGAQPGDLGDCREDHATDCHVLLLPLLERYAKKPESTG